MNAKSVETEKMKDVGVRILFTLGIILIASIPLDLILLSRALLQPTGFWQNLVLYGAGLYFLGSLQFIFVIGAIVGLYITWTA